MGRRDGVDGVTLHCYRYAWAERAKQCGYPERFAQKALGHNSKAVHRAHSRKAQVKLPSLENYEKQAAAGNLLPFQPAATTADGGRGNLEGPFYDPARRGP